MTSIESLGEKYFVRDSETQEDVMSLLVVKAEDLYRHLNIVDTTNIDLTKVTDNVKLVKQKFEETNLKLSEVYWHCTTSDSYNLWDVVGVCYDNNIGVAIIEFRDEIK